jgi:hypothetical protein
VTSTLPSSGSLRAVAMQRAIEAVYSEPALLDGVRDVADDQILDRVAYSFATPKGTIFAWTRVVDGAESLVISPKPPPLP